jgi:predicted Fe-Mo cluster-binding NifX family protein
MRIAIPVTADGLVDPRFGKTPIIAVAAVTDGEITDWTTYDVAWDVSHDSGTEGAHHARIVRFMREHEITHVVCMGMGQRMQRTLGKMGIVRMSALMQNARQAVEFAIKTL